MTQRYLVTSALPYSNGRLHVGHVAGAYLPADTYVRYRRAVGDEVRFICGSDDNGVAALIAARKEGKTVEELTANYNARQAADFRGLGIEFDIYGGTHQPEFAATHAKLSQQFFKTLYDKGFFSKRATQQLYDVQAGQFLPDRYVKGTCPNCGFAEAYGDQCEHCGQAMDPVKLINPLSTITGTKPELRETTHWYLQLGRFQEPLKQWLESRRHKADDAPGSSAGPESSATPGDVNSPGTPGAPPPWRDIVLNFSLGQIKQGLPERAMTRDLSWGIPVPLDDPDAAGKVLYVWFDAPIGYVSFTAELCRRLEGDWQNYRRWWNDPQVRLVHFIGEDNTIFHALIWPAMLMAEGSYPLPWYVCANAFLNIKFPGQEEQKISKSRGTAVWIEEYLKSFDPDPLRYYLTAIAPENQRTAFDVDDFIARNNNELVATLGNFINRTLKFVHDYAGNVVPPAPEGVRQEKDRAQLAMIAEKTRAVAEQLDGFHFKAALTEVMALARAGNVYFDESKPWKQRKENPDQSGATGACGTTINVCLQTIKALTTLMGPFLPFSARRCLEMLALPPEALQWGQATVEMPAGHALGEPGILFKKLDPKEVFTQP